jgi:hypothetical protein
VISASVDVYPLEPGRGGPVLELGTLRALRKAVAHAGPEALFAIDENFFPLSVWLKDPMRRAVDDLNRRADRLAEARGNLDQRLGIISEMKKPEFARRVAGPEGAYLTDTVFQSAGIDGLRSASPRPPAFEGYDWPPNPTRLVLCQTDPRLAVVRCRAPPTENRHELEPPRPA